MRDLEKAIAAYERTQEGPDWYVEEMTDAADELVKAARAYIAAQDDDAANNGFVAPPIRADAKAPDPYQPLKPVDQLAVAVEALEKIASRHVTKDPLWWQRAAREALEQVQGEKSWLTRSRL